MTRDFVGSPIDPVRAEVQLLARRGSHRFGFGETRPDLAA